MITRRLAVVRAWHSVRLVGDGFSIGDAATLGPVAGDTVYIYDQPAAVGWSRSTPGDGIGLIGDSAHVSGFSKHPPTDSFAISDQA